MTHRKQRLFLNLTCDLIFKNYFKSYPSALKLLLKAFLPLPKGHVIKSVTVLDSPLLDLNQDAKNSIMDLRLKLDSGELVNVEMQIHPHSGFTKRILFYWARNYSSQLKIGEEYKKLYPAYSLIFCGFDLFPQVINFYNTFSLKSDQVSNLCFTKDIRIVTVELSKFKKQDIDSLVDLKESWCYLLNHAPNMGESEEIALSSKSSEMEKIMGQLKTLSKEEQYRILEEAREKNRRDEVARREYAIQKGKQEGMEQGMEQGMKQGIHKSLRDVALNMLKKSTDIGFISEVTGLSEEEVKKLHTQL